MLDRVRILAFSLLAFGQACVIQPYDGEIVGNYGVFTVAGYTDTASSLVVVEAYNWTTGGWEQLGSATTGTSPSYAAGHWSADSPDLYYFSTSVAVADAAIPATHQRWTGWPDGSAKLRIRNVTKGTSLYRGEYESLSCFLTTIEPSSNFAATAYNCGYDDVELWVRYIG